MKFLENGSRPQPPTSPYALQMYIYVNISYHMGWVYNILLLQMRALHILTAPSRLSYPYACISSMYLYKYIILHELGT